MVLLFVASHAVRPRWPRRGGHQRVAAAAAGSGSLDNRQHQQEDPSTGADAVRKDREPRPARRQLSRFLLCVTGSWKRSCGSSCSLAAGRLQRPGGTRRSQEEPKIPTRLTANGRNTANPRLLLKRMIVSPPTIIIISQSCTVGRVRLCASSWERQLIALTCKQEEYIITLTASNPRFIRQSP